MKYRVSTYTPRTAPGTARQKRRRGRRRGMPPIFRLALLAAMPVLVLLILHISRPAYMDQAAAISLADQKKPSTAETNSAKNDFAADAAEDKPLAAVEPPAAPVSSPDESAEDAPGGEYDFSAPVPESSPVEDSYFDDAVFIGDSRAEGLILNTGLTNATAYVHKGLTVDTVFTEPVINKDGQKLSVMDALKSTQFSKVYIMLGINETGWVYSQIFQSKYGDIIDSIREINPSAIIYIQGIMPVSNKVSSTHSDITNDRINEYNLLLQELAEEKQVYYIDTENAVASEDGSLPADAAADGIHLVKGYCEKWLDYLKTHSIAS